MILLDTALAYAARGWCILPAREKKPTVPWKAYQAQRPTEAELRTFFGSGRPPDGLGVLCGPVSGGLTCRDFDDADAYHRWAQEHPELSDNLATVKTHRGYNVYFRSDVSKIITMPDGEGELRGAGFCVLPPSRHPAGIIYEWVHPLPDGPLPKLDPFAVGLAEHRSATSVTDKPFVLPSVLTSVLYSVTGGTTNSLEAAVDRAIAETLPTGPGERNDLLFPFARRLKGIPAYADAPAKAMRPHVQEWHRRALAVIGTKSFDDTWGEFTWAWERVQFPIGCNPLELATAQARANPPPAVSQQYESPETVLLIGLCRELQYLSGEAPFYLSCRSAGECVGLDHQTAWRRLKMLERDGVLAVDKRGNARSATRYRYRGGP